MMKRKFCFLQFIEDMQKNLREQLNNLIYSSINDEQFVNKAKKQISEQMLKERRLLDQRWTTNLQGKEWQRQNAFRFCRNFAFTRQLSSPSQFYQKIDYISFAPGFFLNFNSSMPSIQMLGDQEQVEYWRQEMHKGNILVGYAQTQMGHGSNLKALQTRATYDEKSEQWVLDSPTLTSAKMWPGLLGHYATHVVVMAQAYVKEQHVGMHGFMVQIRDSNYRALKGVEAFDIGAKMGVDLLDNGCLVLTKVRVPRRAMLMKFIQVSKEGQIGGLQNMSQFKYSYGHMLISRVKIVFLFISQQAVFPVCNIYNILKQTGEHRKEENRQFLIDVFCIGFGVFLGNIHNSHLYASFKKEFQSKNFKNADKLMGELHIVSSTYKALATWLGIQAGRRILDRYDVVHFKTAGFAFSFYSFVASTTIEGDNIVLLQQTARYLLKKIDTKKEQEDVVKEFKSNDWQNAVKALEYVVAKEVSNIKGRINELTQKGIPYKTIWNQIEQVSLIRVSQIWGYMKMIQFTVKVANSFKENEQFFKKICGGFCHNLLQKIPQLYQNGFIIHQQQTWKTFSDEEYTAIGDINNLIQRKFEPMSYIPRKEGKWLSAKL